jgi:hypothetical protein
MTPRPMATTAITVPGCLPVSAVMTTTGSRMPFQPLGTESEPSHDPRWSYQSGWGTPVGFMLGTIGGGKRVQCTRSFETTLRAPRGRWPVSRGVRAGQRAAQTPVLAAPALSEI